MTLLAPATREQVAAPSAEPASDQPARSRWLVVAAVAGVGFLLLYAVLAVIRLRYPYEIEWIEGGMVEHVAQIRAGHALYASPSLTFTADIYTPLYFVVSALVSFATGLGFFPLRLVSVVASLALFGALAKLATDETGDRVTGVVAAGLFAACFRIGGAWLDTARVDTLCLALLFWGLVVARRARTPRNAAVAGLLMSLAFLAKQVALVPALAVGAYLLAARRGRSVVGTYAGVVVAGIAGTSVAANVLTHGWYGFYVFELPTRHRIDDQAYVQFFTHDLVRPLGLALALVVAAFIAMRRRPDALLFHGLTGSALLVAAYTARLHTGGYDNVLLPIYADVALLAAIGAHHLLRRGVSRWITAAAAIVVLGQFALLVYNPADQLPSAARRREGAQMMAALRALPAPAYLPGHPWYLVEAGQSGSAQSAAIEDVFRGDHDASGPGLARSLWDAVAQQRFAAIVVDSGEGFSYLPDDLCRYYRPDHTLDPGGGVTLPLTGTMTGPKTVWVPRAEPADDCHATGSWTVGPDG